MALLKTLTMATDMSDEAVVDVLGHREAAAPAAAAHEADRVDVSDCFIRLPPARSSRSRGNPGE